MIIRQEEPKDYEAVYHVVKAAFGSAEHTDGKVTGHILFTEVKVGGTVQLALAPLSVLPAFQKQGIGKALIRAGHEKAAALGYLYSIVLGSERYYPQMGYLPAGQYGIKPPFDVPSENFMACKLAMDAPAVSGTVQYAEEFGIG